MGNEHVSGALEKHVNVPRVVIAGDRSSAGKTTLCIGVLSALRARGLEVQGFKVGLDYIDPGFHTLVSGRPSRNLDGFLMAPEVVKEIVIRGCEGVDIAIIEGVRGLYEGLNYFDDVGSTAQIAKILGCPVILVIDATSITRSAAAVINGYVGFDPNVQIAGVILNNIGSERHGEKAQNAIEEYSGIQVIGKIPRSKDLRISMRHLGLITATECKNRWTDFNSVLEKIRTSVEKNVDLNALCAMAHSARPLKVRESGLFQGGGVSKEPKIKIAVAFDEAFNFYYQDTLDLLALEGAELLYFSPIREKKLPEGADAVYLGGGFPELYAEELSSNVHMFDAIRAFFDDYGVIYAECGGLMYLMERLEYKDKSYELSGVLKGSVRFGERRVVNYVEGEFRENCILGQKGSGFKGHEFHHSTITLEDNYGFAYKILRGEGIADGMDGIISKNCLASFTHLHAASYTGFAKNFVTSARKRRAP
jgi:cobyrinic acid a,c-diamide synthase